MQFENAIYRVICKKKELHVFFRGPHIIFKNKWVLHIHFGWIVANQNETIRMKTLYILNKLHKGFSKEAPKLSRKMTLTHSLWVKNKKRNNWNYDTTRFEIALYMVLHKWSNIAAPCAELQKIQEKLNRTHSLRVERGKAI